jgi:hypothetical protein
VECQDCEEFQIFRENRSGIRSNQCA